MTGHLRPRNRRVRASPRRAVKLGEGDLLEGTASAAQNVGVIAALGVGGYIALAGLWAAPVISRVAGAP